MGGLVGSYSGSLIENSNFEGQIRLVEDETVLTSAGGLVGNFDRPSDFIIDNISSEIKNSDFVGDIGAGTDSAYFVGGLVGFISDEGVGKILISDSHVIFENYYSGGAVIGQGQPNELVFSNVSWKSSNDYLACLGEYGTTPEGCFRDES